MKRFIVSHCSCLPTALGGGRFHVLHFYSTFASTYCVFYSAERSLESLELLKMNFFQYFQNLDEVGPLKYSIGSSLKKNNTAFQNRFYFILL